MTVKNIRITDNAKYVILTKHGNNYYHYFIDKLDTVNRYCDVGAFRVKAKKNPDQ